MKPYLPFLFMNVIFASVSSAQCSVPSAKETLNINEVSALILNGGDLHWDFSSAGYEVPKGSGKKSIFASALWMGGIDAGGNLHTSAMTYRQQGIDFWPGPLDTNDASADATASAQYNKIWKLNRYKIEEFKYEWNLGNVQNGSYTPDANILSWPGNGDLSKGQARYLAPFVDVNNNTIYDPLIGGDYPIIKGDQMLYWIFNDNCGTHTETGGLPFGVEIHASAYAYTCSQLPDSLQVLNYSTFYHYEIINRSSFQYDSVYIGYWQDADLGCYTDDFMGCNPQDNYGYVYNSDSNDEIACLSPGYGSHPPILSTVMLKTPAQDLMSSFKTYNNLNGTPNGNPASPAHYYNYLSGKWGDGTPMTYGGYGYGGTVPTTYMFPDFPYSSTGWSEVTAGNIPYDRRSLMSSGSFTMLPGATIDFDFAIAWSRDMNSTYGTQAYFDKNLKDNLKIKQWYQQNSFPSCLELNLAVQDEGQQANRLAISPNPASDLITINYESKTKYSHFEIVDVLGRTRAVSKQRQIDVSLLPQGMYFVKVTDGDLNFTKRFVKK